jgi:uncharacterized damage-inducible protein DinB
MDATSDKIFLRFSADKLRQLTGRISDCLNQLNYEQIWARSSDNENAVGNLVLHLCGNVRQWIGSGIGGKPDVRVRDREFRARGDVQPSDLRERLEGIIAEAAPIIEAVPAERLTERVTIQSYDVSVLEAIYHVVEHFSQHTGQIIFATKQLTGRDMGFYSHLTKAAPHSEPTP